MSKTTMSAPACAAAKAARSAATSGWTRASMPGEEARVGRDRVAQPVAVDARRRRPPSGARSASAAAPAAAGGVEPVHRGVGVPDRHAGLGEEPGGRRLAHADRAGEAEAVGPLMAPAPRRAARRRPPGRRPNQRSKPGTAWCSSIPSPSTATRPRARAARDEGRRLGAVDDVGDQRRRRRRAPRSSGTGVRAVHAERGGVDDGRGVGGRGRRPRPSRRPRRARAEMRRAAPRRGRGCGWRRGPRARPRRGAPRRSPRAAPPAPSTSAGPAAARQPGASWRRLAMKP